MQSPEPAAHGKVFDSNSDRLGIWKCWFLRRGETGVPGAKPVGAKDENQVISPRISMTI